MSSASSSSINPNPSPAPSEAEPTSGRSTSPLPLDDAQPTVPAFVSSRIHIGSNIDARGIVRAYPTGPSASNRGARNRNRARDRLRTPRSTRLRRRVRTTTRCLCLPVMVVTSMAAILLFVLLVGLPFLLFMAGLVIVYYCCTSNPIPFRTLLRAMVGVEDWQGTAFDGTTGSDAYAVTKDDIRKGTIRRLCLGPMVVAHSTSDTTENAVGGDLSTLPRNHPGRVHWRNEGTSETCLVFSAPLDTLKAAPTCDSVGGLSTEDTNDANAGDSAMILRQELRRNGAPVEVNADASEMMLRQESLRAKIPKYLQQCKEEEIEEKGNDAEDDVESGKEGEAKSVEEDSNCSIEEMPPLESAEQLTDDPAGEPANETDSSARDRGTVCDICLLEFETGEAVAWSPNPACNHAYHEDCITDWLLRKPTCPSCRHNFIVVPAVLRPDNISSESSSDSDSNSNNTDWTIHANESRVGSTNQSDGIGDVELGTVGTGP